MPKSSKVISLQPRLREVTVILPAGVVEAVDDFAKRSGLNREDILIEAIREWPPLVHELQRVECGSAI